jgi:hypothetical protein
MKYLLNGLLALTVICLTPIQAENLTPKQMVGWKQELVEIEKTLPLPQSISERIFINAYIADTPTKRTQGLMHVADLHENEGMLFIFNPPRYVSMWMKNTVISLDIVFIKANGTIAHIYQDAKPLSLRSIPSIHKVKWVLELNAGVTGKLNLKPGDKLVLGKTD